MDFRLQRYTPNLQLKIAQSPINKGRKTSWRLSEPPTNLPPYFIIDLFNSLRYYHWEHKNGSQLEVSERLVGGWSNLQLPPNALYIGISEENSWRLEVL